MTTDSEPSAGAASIKPAGVVVILLDSLNRHLLGAYGSTEFDTPTLDAFASESLVFTSHYAGSLPCMPARHDILCGTWDFLWRPWGSVELWDRPLTVNLRQAGVTTMLVSDHPHLFETGGENYHVDFTAWDYQRGHETDPWRTRPDPSFIGAPRLLPTPDGYQWSDPKDDPYPWARTRGWIREEEDFPGPRTMQAAADWLTTSARHHDRFLLFVDEFDPHEPFDTPEPWASRYGTWEGPRLIWPPYLAGKEGALTNDQARHIRGNYGSKLSMIDHWLSKVLDAIDDAGLRESTAVVVCTDHGHWLGERDIWGKPGVPLFDPMSKLPLFIRWPGRTPGEINALTASVDLHATILDIFDARNDHVTHGRSLLPLVTEQEASIRDWTLAGIWGREVHLVTDTHKYIRAPTEENRPLSMWSNRWSTMPIPVGTGFLDASLLLPPPDHRAKLDHMPAAPSP